MMTDEEKKKVLEGLNNNKKKKQAHLQGVNYINEILRSGVIEDITFLKDLFRFMFQSTAKERFTTRDERKAKRKNITKSTPETTFTLEKALINICYKYFNSDLFDILEKEINLHKKALGLELPDFLKDFYNVYCSFGILKLKYFGVKIEDLDHFVKFCDPKYREKIKVLTKKNSPKETIDFSECFNKFKTYEEVQSESHSYFSLEDFYRLNSKITDFKFAKLANLSSFRNNLERQMKKCLEQIFNKKFTEAKSNLKELRKNEQYKKHIEIRLHINNLLILCHVELAEYFECDYYLNLSIDEAMANDLKYIYFYFLNLKFTIERIGFIEGPRSCIRFDFEDIKERKLILKDFIKMNQVDLNTQLRDCKLTTQISLAAVKDDIRELRNLETYKFLDIDKLFMNIKILSQEYSIISLYVINDILHINLFDQIFNTKINFKDFSSELNTILAASKDILRRNVQSRKDKSDWWIDRLELESKLQKLLKDIKIDCKLMNDHVILILDEKSTNFPWEHTSFLKDKHVFRIPSLEYLNLKEMKRPVEGLSWIVDPDNNLEGTRKRILNYFDTKNLIKNEENFNVLLYFGHGGGSKYIKNIKNKILFLFGCCSSKILNVQNFKRNGKVLNHLEKGNTLIGCLWEVTDKDLDMISMNIIDNLFNKKCLACIIKESISVAKLPYLNGCSLVVYGLPIILTKECE